MSDSGGATLTAVDVATWRISDSVSAVEATLYHSALVQRLVNEVERLATTEGSEDHRRRLAETMGNLRRVWPTPEHVWYARKYARRASGFRDLETALCLLETVPRGPTPPPLRCGEHASIGAWTRYGVEHILDDLRSRGRGEASVALECDNSGEIGVLVSECLGVLRDVWPEAAAEHERLVREIVVLSGTGLQSASVPFTFGAVYLCPRPAWTLLNYLDLLLHEAGHHSLTMKFALADLIRNPKAEAYSPLRCEPRPVTAVLHATFVLARITHGLMRLLDADCGWGTDDVHQLLRLRTGELEQGLTSLAASADWTEPGEHLFADLRLASKEVTV